MGDPVLPPQTKTPSSATLPTGRLGDWTVAKFRDSLASALVSDSAGECLRLYFYAVTISGWRELKPPMLKWLAAKQGRSIVLYAGTDHGITDPRSIVEIHAAGIEVRIMKKYSGVFHPKMVWLAARKRNLLWVGSNNLTRDGLLNNIEFALRLEVVEASEDLQRWAALVHAGSVPFADDLVESYRSEREAYEAIQAKSRRVTFTWSRREEADSRLPSSSPQAAAVSTLKRGSLILEIMPEETRGGNQIQIPKEAANQFFGLTLPGERISISLSRRGSKEKRQLVITVFSNNTVRLSINELEHGDRPCVVVLEKVRGKSFTFDIIPESIYPTQYRNLLAACNRQTRRTSRRWGLFEVDAR